MCPKCPASVLHIFAIASQGLLTLLELTLPRTILSTSKAERVQFGNATSASDNAAGRKMDPALWVAPEKASLCVARRLFGITKPLSSRLDCHFFQGNRDYSSSVNRPMYVRFAP